MREENFRKPARDCQEINAVSGSGRMRCGPTGVVGRSAGFPIKNVGNDEDEHGANPMVGPRLTRSERGCEAFLWIPDSERRE